MPMCWIRRVLPTVSGWGQLETESPDAVRYRVKPRSPPASIEGRAFSVREALGGAAVVIPTMFPPTRGSQGGAGAVRRRRASACLPGGLGERTAYSHVTAAELWCLPLPRSLEGDRARRQATTTRGGRCRAGCAKAIVGWNAATSRSSMTCA